MAGVSKRIKALKDFELKTCFERHILIKDEVKIVRFKSMQIFEGLLEFHNFRLATSEEPVNRRIPILLPPDIDEDELVAVGPIEILPPMELVNDEDIFENMMVPEDEN